MIHKETFENIRCPQYESIKEVKILPNHFD